MRRVRRDAIAPRTLRMAPANKERSMTRFSLAVPALAAALFAPAAPGAPTFAPPATFLNTTAVMESHRHATRHVVEGSVLGVRTPDLKLSVNLMHIRSGWEDVPIPHLVPPQSPAPSLAKSRPSKAPKKP